MDKTTRFNNTLNEWQQTIAGDILKMPQAYSPNVCVTFILNAISSNSFPAAPFRACLAFAANVVDLMSVFYPGTNDTALVWSARNQ